MTTRRSTPPPVPEGKSVPLVWAGIEDHRIEFANQMMVQVHDTDIILTFGQMAPPAIVGPVSNRREAFEALQYVPVKTVARVALTPARIRAFIKILNEGLRNRERIEQAEK